jgi:hypothetical protein
MPSVTVSRAITADQIPTGLVSSSKLTQRRQSGSAKIRQYTTTGSFTAFPTSYGSPPIVAVNPLTGSPIIKYAYPYAVGPGSFGLLGSPRNQYVHWEALGFT